MYILIFVYNIKKKLGKHTINKYNGILLSLRTFRVIY